MSSLTYYEKPNQKVFQGRRKYSSLGGLKDYDCSHSGTVYRGFANSGSCLCKKPVRSLGDMYIMEGKSWPMSNDSLGWK